MTSPIIVIVPLNDRIPEAIVKASSGRKDHPAFYVLSTPEGQTYAGSTGAIDRRVSVHKSNLKTGKHAYSELQSTVDKGLPIKMTVKYTSSREVAFNAEQEFLSKNADNPNLLNKSLDARAPGKGHVVSEEHKQKIREANTGRIPSEYNIQRTKEANTGKRPSEYNIQRIKETHTGKIVSEETRQKMSESLKGRVCTPSMREAVSKASSKPVEIDGTMYPSQRSAAEALKVSDVTIGNRVRSLSPKFSNYSLKE